MSSKVRSQGEKVRQFLLSKITAADGDPVNATMQKFGITRQAVNKHITKLKEQGTITQEGTTRNRVYKLAAQEVSRFDFDLNSQLEEDMVWSGQIRPILEFLPANVLNIWHHGFTEMFNNAIDHSSGKRITVFIEKTASDTSIFIIDDGIGIFKKIKDACGLVDERQALFELSKGKLTTDPSRHSGEGIFFTSRMFDAFQISAGDLLFDHERNEQFDVLAERHKLDKGTIVFMRLSNHTALTTKKIFDEFSSGDDYSFSKTIVPVKLAKHGEDELVSRSQAKRLLARVELFETVIFDFAEVSSIGQAFSDQIFRVFKNEHPNIQILYKNANEEVLSMIKRALSHHTL